VTISYADTERKKMVVSLAKEASPDPCHCGADRNHGGEQEGWKGVGNRQVQEIEKRASMCCRVVIPMKTAWLMYERASLARWQHTPQGSNAANEQVQRKREEGVTFPQQSNENLSFCQRWS
jgi:hypothetical protein